MALLKDGFTYKRYQVLGDMPDNFASFINQQIRKFAFQKLESQTEEIAIGWTSIDNAIDTEFSYANYAIGEYLIFSLRVDKKNIPASLLKIKTQEAEKAFLEEKKQARLYKEQRKNILEAVRQDLLGKTLPIPSFYDVCWCVSENWLVFGSHSETINEHFIKIFERTFELKLQHWIPWNKGFIEPEYAKQLEESGGTQGPGREFLTWLWYKSEEKNGSINLEGEDIEINFGRKIILESGDGDYTETVSCQGIHSEMEEGKSALRRGKKIKEARIKLGKDNTICNFSIKADSFQIQSLKMPLTIVEVEDTDRDGRTLERIYHVEEVNKTMDRLFKLFLKTRFSDQWLRDDLPKMKRWLEAA
jgi:recombination associated protein RdgC